MQCASLFVLVNRRWLSSRTNQAKNTKALLVKVTHSLLHDFSHGTGHCGGRQLSEHAFAANQKALNAIPTPFVAPIMFVLDLVCSAGLLLFALANAKVIATLVAVVAVARARRVAKA